MNIYAAITVSGAANNACLSAIKIIDAVTHTAIETLSARYEDTTVNAGLILSAIAAVKYAYQKKANVTVVTNADYLENGINLWIDGWKQRGWRNSAKKPVLNKELWAELDKMIVQNDQKVIFMHENVFKNQYGGYTPGTAQVKAPIELADEYKPQIKIREKVESIIINDKASIEDAQKIIVYTDGACSGNPGPGGYAVIVTNEKEEIIKKISGSERDSTNNRMETMAILEALRLSLEIKRPITIISDSKYAIDGVSSWLAGWKKRGWRTASGSEVVNMDIWQEIDAVVSNPDLPCPTYQWVKGHAGNHFNEVADQLAVHASLKA